MTSCPDESALTLLVDGDLSPEHEVEVLDHLALCDDCRSLLGRSEAALRYALGGLADAGERPVPDHVEVEPAVEREPASPRRPARVRMRVLVGALVAAAAVTIGAWQANDPDGRSGPGYAQWNEVLVQFPDHGLTGDWPERPLPEVIRRADQTAQLDALLARAERLSAPAPAQLSDERDLLALGALAAAETRGAVLGAAPERARLRDVVDLFPGTSAARVAAQRLATLEPPR